MANLIDSINTHDTTRSAARFAVVGMLGTLLDLALFTVFFVMLGAPTLVANTLSYSAGILNNYILHRKWTFAHRPQKSVGKQFFQFAGVSLSALLLNNLIVLLLAPPLGNIFADPAHAALFAKLTATGVGMGWNFIANHLWTFRVSGVSGDCHLNPYNTDTAAANRARISG